MTIKQQDIIDLYQAIDTYRAKYYLTANSWAFHGEKEQGWEGECKPGNRKLTITGGTTRYPIDADIDTSLYDYFMIDVINSVSFPNFNYTIREYNFLYNAKDYFLTKGIDISWDDDHVYIIDTEVANVDMMVDGEPYVDPGKLGTAYNRYINKLKLSYYVRLSFDGNTIDSNPIVPGRTTVIDLSGDANWTGTVSDIRIYVITDISVPVSIIQNTAIKYIKFDDTNMLTVPTGQYILKDYIQIAKTYIESMNDGDPFWTSDDDIRTFDWVRSDDIGNLISNLQSIPPNNGCTVTCDTYVAGCNTGDGLVGCQVCDGDGYVPSVCATCNGYTPCTCEGCDQEATECNCNEPCYPYTTCTLYVRRLVKVPEPGCTCDIQQYISVNCPAGYDPSQDENCLVERGEPVLCSWCYERSDDNCARSDYECYLTDVINHNTPTGLPTGVSQCERCDESCHLQGAYTETCWEACYAQSYDCKLYTTNFIAYECPCYTVWNNYEYTCTLCNSVVYVREGCICEGIDMDAQTCLCEYCDEQGTPCSCNAPVCDQYADCTTCNACNQYEPCVCDSGITYNNSSCAACDATVQY